MNPKTQPPIFEETVTRIISANKDPPSDGEGVHTVKKRLEFGGDIDVETLKREIVRIARHAYNAHSGE